MTTSEKPLRAVIVGCHGIGKTHAKAMKQAGMKVRIWIMLL